MRGRGGMLDSTDKRRGGTGVGDVASFRLTTMKPGMTADRAFDGIRIDHTSHIQVEEEEPVSLPCDFRLLKKSRKLTLPFFAISQLVQSLASRTWLLADTTYLLTTNLPSKRRSLSKTRRSPWTTARSSSMASCSLLRNMGV